MFMGLGRPSVLAFLLGTWMVVHGSMAQESHDHHAKPSARYHRGQGDYQFPAVTLVDMSGTAVPLERVDEEHGPLLLQFIFTTCPTVCPVMSGIFAGFQKQMGAEVERIRMLSITIDPEHDTPARLRAYAQDFEAKRQWRFLTGSLQDIVSVQRAFDVFTGNKMRHRPITFLRAAPGAPWIRLNGLMSAAELVAEYRRLVTP